MILKDFCNIMGLLWTSSKFENFGLGNGERWKSQYCSYLVAKPETNTSFFSAVTRKQVKNLEQQADTVLTTTFDTDEQVNKQGIVRRFLNVLRLYNAQWYIKKRLNGYFFFAYFDRVNLKKIW
jgi:hypothetical protein